MGEAIILIALKLHFQRKHMENYDAIIVGGGPGGSTCATVLGKMGHKVLVLDKAKFPRDKICGDGITGKSRGFIQKLGLIDEMEENGAIYDGIEVIWPRGSRTLIKSDGGYYSYVCKRQIFDNILFQNAKKVSDTKEEFAVTDMIVEDGKVVGVKATDLSDKSSHEFRAKIVVGADGANSVVATKLGLNKFDASHRISAIRAYYKNVKNVDKNLEIFFFEKSMPGYFWIFPLPNGQANIGIGMNVKDMQKKKISLQKIMEDEIANNPAIKDRFDGAELVSDIKAWTLPTADAFRKNYGDGFVLIGDASSLIDPMSGEGIGNAMMSANIAAEVIDDALKKNDFSSNQMKNYYDLLWKKIGQEVKTNHMYQRLAANRTLLKFFEPRIAKSNRFIQTMKFNFLDSDSRDEMSKWKLSLKDLFSFMLSR
jgi:geranylgeranyl reductase family protein